ncbi:hypothetical protein [Paraglaciecola sp. 20A4]|uniref:hypothetical protein n=1 Tax=Paraglaciecola sp. 20A4 TaxID=2687288 RepID=UPI00140C97EF|nr:hypothetical protein [Paraglaciecola sp. 20A4]
MKSNLMSFDYLLNDHVLEQNWKQLTAGYRNLLVEQQLQTDFVESFESTQSLSELYENSFTQFLEEVNLTAIERLTGYIENKVSLPQSNVMPAPRLREESALQVKREESKIIEPKVIAKQKKIIGNTSHEVVKPSNKLTQIKTTKNKLNPQVTVITADFARTELNNRAVCSGWGYQWSERKLASRHEVKPEISQYEAQATIRGVGNTDAILGAVKKDVLHAHNNNTELTKEKGLTLSSNKTIDRLIDEKVKTIQSAKKTDFNVMSNSTQHANNIVKVANPSPKNGLLTDDGSSNVPSAISPLSTSSGVGGLRGLAALAKANVTADQPLSPETNEVNENRAVATSIQKPSLNIVDNTASSSQITTASGIAKLLAQEARRAGIDLEKFQP